MKRIDIPFAAHNSREQKTFPVVYAIEDKEQDCIQIFRCEVTLPPAQLPAWLRPGAFELVTHVRDGMQLVDYNASASSGAWNSLDADAFRYKVYTEIFFREKNRRREKFQTC